MQTDNPMQQEKRIEYFEKLLKDKGKSIGSMDLWYKNERKTLSVYEIDLQYLIHYLRPLPKTAFPYSPNLVPVHMAWNNLFAIIIRSVGPIGF